MKQPATGIPIDQAYAPQVIPIDQAYAPQVIPIAQPYAPQVPHQQQAGQTVEFSTGLCDCCSDCSLCCLTCWCPCITFGRIAEIVDRGSSSCGVSGALYTLLFTLTGFHWVYSCTYRSKLKALYGMQVDCCGDCCIHCCCEPCALCQEYRELQHRGYNMTLGWHGNMERQNPGMMPPPVAGGMSR